MGKRWAALAAALALCGVSVARADDTRTWNQATAATLLTKSDSTVISPTRGLFIGDASACNIAVVFDRNSAAVTLASVQPGLVYPVSVTKLMSTNTTCTLVTALY